MTLLTAVSDAMSLCLNITTTQVVSNTDQTVSKFLTLAQIEVDDTFPAYNWRFAPVDLVITGDGSTTLWPLASDFEHIQLGNALWSQKYPSIPLTGPMSEVEILALKALPVNPLRPVWRLRGSKLEIWPALAAGEIVNGVYYSTNPILANDGVTTRLRWAADTDIARFPETILRNGLVWRWKASKGRDYAEDFRTYALDRDLKAAHEQGGRIVNTSRVSAMPDNAWAGVITIIP